MTIGLWIGSTRWKLKNASGDVKLVDRAIMKLPVVSWRQTDLHPNEERTG